MVRFEELRCRNVFITTAANMTVSQNPEKMGKRIDKALQKIVSKWQKMKAKMQEDMDA